MQKGKALVFLWCQSPHSQGLLPQILPAPGSWDGWWVPSGSALNPLPDPETWLPVQPDTAVTAIDPFHWLHPQGERWK